METPRPILPSPGPKRVSKSDADIRQVDVSVQFETDAVRYEIKVDEP